MGSDPLEETSLREALVAVQRERDELLAESHRSITQARDTFEELYRTQVNSWSAERSELQGRVKELEELRRIQDARPLEQPQGLEGGGGGLTGRFMQASPVKGLVSIAGWALGRPPASPAPTASPPPVLTRSYLDALEEPERVDQGKAPSTPVPHQSTSPGVEVTTDTSHREEVLVALEHHNQQLAAEVESLRGRLAAAHQEKEEAQEFLLEENAQLLLHVEELQKQGQGGEEAAGAGADAAALGARVVELEALLESCDGERIAAEAACGEAQEELRALGHHLRGLEEALEASEGRLEAELARAAEQAEAEIAAAIDAEAEVAAAVRIQSLHRGRAARKEYQARRAGRAGEEVEEEAAALRVQAITRGRAARRRADELRALRDAQASRAEVVALRGELEGARAEVARLTAKAEELAAGGGGAVAAVEGDLETARAEVTSLQADLNVYFAEVSELREDLQRRDDEVQTKDAQAYGLRQELTRYLGDKGFLEATAREQAREVEALSLGLEEAQEQVAGLISDLEAAAADREALYADLQGARRARDAMRGGRAKLEAAAVAAGLREEKLREEGAVLRQQVAELELRAGEMEATASRARAVGLDKALADVRALGQERDGLLRRVQELGREATRAAAAAAAAEDRAEDAERAAASRAAAAAADSQAQELEAEIQDLRADLEAAWAAREAAELALEGAALAQGEAAEAELRKLRAALGERCDMSQGEADQLRARVREEVAWRRRLLSEIIELKGNIRVVCRVRPPLTPKEAAAAAVFKVLDDGGRVHLEDPERGTEGTFDFSAVFGPGGAGGAGGGSQADVYAEVSPLVRSVVDGYPVCIFAYGQTGSGKTYTMEGPPGDRGVSYRAVEELFSMLGAGGLTTHEVRVSFMEIYQESIRDLLAPHPGSQCSSRLEVMTDGEGQTHIPGLTVRAVGSTEEVLRVLGEGNRVRAQAATNINEHSSRSHAIFTVYTSVTDAATGATAAGKLHLIDLAGSERVSKSGATGERMKEAQAINKSLSTLGDIIAALQARATHVPYRNSKLTYVLQDSLGGSAKTMMIVNCSPHPDSAGESMCSLNFADRATKVELGQAKRSVSAASPSPPRPALHTPTTHSAAAKFLRGGSKTPPLPSRKAATPGKSPGRPRSLHASFR